MTLTSHPTRWTVALAAALFGETGLALLLELQ